MRITDQTVRGLTHPDTGQRDYADDAVAGLAVRVGRRTKTFVLTTGTRASGNRKRHTLGQYDPPHFTLAMAREKARDMLAVHRLSRTEPPRTTFAEALDLYYQVHVSKLRKQSQRGIKQTIDRCFRPKLGKKILSDI